MNEARTLHEAFEQEKDAELHGVRFRHPMIRLTDRFLHGAMRWNSPRVDLRTREGKAKRRERDVDMVLAIAILKAVDEESGVVLPLSNVDLVRAANGVASGDGDPINFGEMVAGMERLMADKLIERLPGGGYQIMPEYAREDRA